MSIKRLIIGGFFACLVLAPTTSFAQSTVSENAYRALLLELIQTLQLQIATLQAELAERQAIVEPEAVIEKEIPSRTSVSSLGELVDLVAVYDLDALADVARIKNREHREYFEWVFSVFPPEYADEFRRLEVFAEDSAGFDAYVETLPPKHEHWLYAVNEEVMEDERSQSSTELIVHELGHIISYDEVIGVPKPAQTTCDEYFETHGCPEENAYLTQFVNDFWSVGNLERAWELQQSGDLFEGAHEYYQHHEDDYVSDYAVQGPEEDFADSFMFYVLEDQLPRGTLAREKVDFFAQYPELVAVRRHILSQ